MRGQEFCIKYFDQGLSLPTSSKEYSNKYLKELGRMANISKLITITRYIGAERIEETKPKYELISNHMVRRTFVTLSLEKGMRPEVVMMITGHKNYYRMKRYVKITNTVKEEEMKRVWSKK